MLIKCEDFDGIVWVFNRTCALLSEHWIKMFRAVWVFAALYLLIEIASYALILNEPIGISVYPLFFLTPLFSGVLWVFMAVRVHRLLLTPENLDIMPFGPMSRAESYFRFTTRAVLFFLLSGILVYLPLLVSFFFLEYERVVVIIFQVVTTIFAIYGLWVLAPLYLTLPSIAIRQVMNFHDVAGLSVKQRLLMFCVVIVIPFVSILFVSILESFWDTQDFYSLSIVTNAIYMMTMIIEVSLLSVAYAYIMREE